MSSAVDGPIKLRDGRYPTILSYDPAIPDYVIGEKARDLGLRNRTSIFHFKVDIGKAPEREFSDPEYARGRRGKYWLDTGRPDPRRYEILTLGEVAETFFKRILLEFDRPPEKIIIPYPPNRLTLSEP